MGLSWQQGPLGRGPVGTFLSPTPLPARLLYVEPLRRRLRVRFAGEWIVDSEDVLLLHEPGHYPVALFRPADVRPDVLRYEERVTRHRDLGDTGWFGVTVGDTHSARAAWTYLDPPAHAEILRDRVAFAWRAMDAFFEEDERIVGHAADPYHRIDIRPTSRHLTVDVAGTGGSRRVADTTRPLVLYESGFAPRWYVPREDVDAAALEPADGRTFCPYKGLADYYDVAGRSRAAWSYPEAWPEVARVGAFVSFEPDKLEVRLDGRRLEPEPGQGVVAHGLDRDLAPGELTPVPSDPIHDTTGEPA